MGNQQGYLMAKVVGDKLFSVSAGAFMNVAILGADEIATEA